MTALDLFAEVTDASGAKYRWDANQPPGSRLRNFSFRTKIGEGFSDAQGQLARRIDSDYPDLELLNDITVTGADGSVAYEGRLASMPRSLAESHGIGVNFAGWVAHAKDRKFSEIYVDRDLNAWGGMSRARKIGLLSSNYTPYDAEQIEDPTDSTAGISTAIQGPWASPFKPEAEAWYDAGPGVLVGKVTGSWKREGTVVVDTDAAWAWQVIVFDDDKGTTSGGATVNLRAAGPGTFSLTATTPSRYAMVYLAYNATPAGSNGTRYGVGWYKLAAYGNHGVTTWDGEAGEPQGVRASDVIKNIARRWCPALNTDGVVDTTYVIQHLAFKDRTFPYDAFLEVNKYHLFHLGVWEGRTLHFRPYDFSDYQWEVRTDEPGTQFDWQGPTTDDLWNGVNVEYTDLVTGVKNVVTVESNSVLRDFSSENPWNKHSLEHYEDVALSTPTIQSQALQVARALLIDHNRPKAPGSIQVKGYIKDRAGNDQPVWKVRAGDTISITNHPNDRPRLIHETSYDDESKTNTLSIDAPASQLDALFDRVATALGARGLT